jgi:hypothetical protein
VTTCRKPKKGRQSTNLSNGRGEVASVFRPMRQGISKGALVFLHRTSSRPPLRATTADYPSRGDRSTRSSSPKRSRNTRRTPQRVDQRRTGRVAGKPLPRCGGSTRITGWRPRRHLLRGWIMPRRGPWWSASARTRRANRTGISATENRLLYELHLWVLLAGRATSEEEGIRVRDRRCDL